jgi:hypothetical protein
MTPSKSSLDRLPKALNEVWERARPLFEAIVRFGETVQEEAVAVGVSLDGVLVPMKDGAREAKREAAVAAGKQTKGPAGYQQASCATLSFYDKEGELLSTIRMGRMPEKGKATLKEMLRQELEHVLAQRPDLTVVKLADGAKDNWRYLRKLPKGSEVLDFYHAAEHLSAALDAAYGEGSAKSKAQFEKLRHVLRHDDDGIAKVIRSLAHLRRQHPRSKKIVTELKYFRRNRRRMRYACGALQEQTSFALEKQATLEAAHGCAKRASRGRRMSVSDDFCRRRACGPCGQPRSLRLSKGLWAEQFAVHRAVSAHKLVATGCVGARQRGSTQHCRCD